MASQLWNAKLFQSREGSKCKHVLPSVQACAVHGGVWQWAQQLWNAKLVLNDIPRHSSLTIQVDQLSQWTRMALRMYV